MYSIGEVIIIPAVNPPTPRRDMYEAYWVAAMATAMGQGRSWDMLDPVASTGRERPE